MNVAMLLEMAADGLGGRVAVGTGEDALTFAGLRSLAAGRAAELEGAGVLAFAGPNGTAVPVSLFAAAWAGCSYAPVNYRLPGAVLAELVSRLAPGAIVRGAGVEVGSSHSTVHEAAEWCAGPVDPSGARAPYPDAPGRPAVLLHTSGTSAAPKVAELGHENLLSYVLNTLEFASADEDEAVLLAVPPFHVAGVASVLSSCYTGRRLVPLERFSPEGWLAAAWRERVTHAFVVPTMLARIVAALDAEPGAQAPPLRALSYGGARMPLPVLERAMERFGSTAFVNAYGLTETSSTVAVLGPDDHREAAASDDPSVRARLGSAGRPLPGVEIAVTGEGGDLLGPGERGEIRVRGAQVAGSYVGVEGAGDGDLLHTGDVGWVDEGGYVFVAGRADDMIIRGGENISPSEVEDAILRHPDVTAAAVVGLPDEEWGESVAAMVTVRDGASASAGDLAAFARDAIGTLKAPQRVVITGGIPVTPTGKVLRREVRRLLEGG